MNQIVCLLQYQSPTIYAGTKLSASRSLRKVNFWESTMMPTRFLRNILILFLIPASLACSLFTSAPTPGQADIEKEEQAVYALFVRDSQGPAVILQNTSTSTVEEDPKQMID